MLKDKVVGLVQVIKDKKELDKDVKKVRAELNEKIKAKKRGKNNGTKEN